MEEVEYLIDTFILDESIPLKTRVSAIVKAIRKNKKNIKKLLVRTLRDLVSDAALDHRAKKIEEKLDALDYKLLPSKIGGRLIIEPYHLIDEYINTTQTGVDQFIDASIREIIAWFQGLYLPNLYNLEEGRFYTLEDKQEILAEAEDYFSDLQNNDILARAIRMNIRQAQRDFQDEETYLLALDTKTF